jgi:hypothetical protein
MWEGLCIYFVPCTIFQRHQEKWVIFVAHKSSHPIAPVFGPWVPMVPRNPMLRKFAAYDLYLLDGTWSVPSSPYIRLYLTNHPPSSLQITFPAPPCPLPTVYLTTPINNTAWAAYFEPAAVFIPFAPLDLTRHSSDPFDIRPTYPLRTPLHNAAPICGIRGIFPR